jgi:hypothetical protein
MVNVTATGGFDLAVRWSFDVATVVKGGAAGDARRVVRPG